MRSKITVNTMPPMRVRGDANTTAALTMMMKKKARSAHTSVGLRAKYSVGRVRHRHSSSSHTATNT